VDFQTLKALSRHFWATIAVAIGNWLVHALLLAVLKPDQWGTAAIDFIEQFVLVSIFLLLAVEVLLFLGANILRHFRGTDATNQ
jgi:hypothetical protein